MQNKSFTFLALLVALGLLALVTRLTQYPYIEIAKASEDTATLSFKEITKTDTSYTSELTLDPGSSSVSGVDFTFQLDSSSVKNATFTPSSEFSTQLLNKFDPESSTLRYSAVETSAKSLNTPFKIGEITLDFKPGTSSKGEVTLLKSQVIASGKDTAVPVTITSPAIYEVTTPGISNNIFIIIAVASILIIFSVLFVFFKKHKNTSTPPPTVLQ